MIRATGAKLRSDRLNLALGGDLSFAVTSANGVSSLIICSVTLEQTNTLFYHFFAVPIVVAKNALASSLI